MWEPGTDFSFRVIADYDQIDEKCCGVVNLRPSAATGAVRAVGGQVNDFNTPFADVVYSDVVPTSKVKNYGISGQGDLKLGALTLTSISAYRRTELDANQDVDYTSARLATGANIGQAKLDTFTQELRLTSDFDGPLNFLLGGYYFNEKVTESDQIVYGADFRKYANILIGGPVTSPPNDVAVSTLEGQFSALTGQNYIGKFFANGQGFFNNVHQSDESYSIFGNVDFEVTDALTVTLGANYTHDSKDVVTTSVSTDVFSGLDLNAIRNTATGFGIAQTIGGILMVPGGFASPAQIAGFAAAQPVVFAQIQAGAAAATAPILGLKPLQFLPPFQNCPNAVEDCRTRDGDWSYTARVAYKVSPTLNVYASYATGYKAASFNLSRDARPTLADYTALVSRGLAVTNLTPGSRFAQPEDSEVYELGLKGNWGLASANLTFFKTVDQELPDQHLYRHRLCLRERRKQSTFGVEFDGQVRPVEPLTLSLAMTYLDPKFDSYANSPLGDLSGTTIVNVPRFRRCSARSSTSPSATAAIT